MLIQLIALNGTGKGGEFDCLDCLAIIKLRILNSTGREGSNYDCLDGSVPIQLTDLNDTRREDVCFNDESLERYRQKTRTRLS